MGDVSAARRLSLTGVVALAIAGCGVDLGATQPWVPVADDDGFGPALRAESSAPPPPGAARSRTPAEVSSLRVVTYNVQYGPAPEAIAAAILGAPALRGADVFLVQEIEAYPAEAGSRAAQLAGLLGLGYVYVPARQVQDGTHGLAILSAFPLQNVQRMMLPDAGKGHPRIAMQAEVVVGDRRLHLINLHLDTKLNTAERLAHLRPAVIDAPQTTLVAGDFNTCWVEWVGGELPVLSSSSASDQAPVVDSYMRALGFATPTAGSGPTEHMLGFELRLDSMYPRGLEVTFGGVEHVGPSDHWPMWMDVTLP